MGILFKLSNYKILFNVNNPNRCFNFKLFFKITWALNFRLIKCSNQVILKLFKIESSEGVVYINWNLKISQNKQL